MVLTSLGACWELSPRTVCAVSGLFPTELALGV